MANTSVIFTPGLCECQVGSGAETNNGPPGLHAAFAILYKLSFLLCDTLHQSTSKLHMDSQALWGSGLLKDACTRLEAAEYEPLPLLKPAWCLPKPGSRRLWQFRLRSSQNWVSRLAI